MSRGEACLGVKGVGAAACGLPAYVDSGIQEELRFASPE